MNLLKGMYGSNEYEECKIGAIHMTMEDVSRMPFDVAFDVESEEEKVGNILAICYLTLQDNMTMLQHKRGVDHQCNIYGAL